ncbi:MAG: efflux RND transporter periplasmic adaptor subunit [Planctomycetota bacterium]
MRHSAPTLLLCLVLGPLPAAAEPQTWAPHDHPATVQRTLTAFTRPWRSMVLAAEVSARVVAVAADRGEAVPADEALVQLEGDRARLALREAEARHQQAVAGVTVAEQAVAQAERTRDHQRQEAERLDALYDEGGLPERERDAARFARDAAELALARARAEHARSRAASALAAAAVDRAEDHLARHRIAGPGGWVVSERHVHPGSLATAGMPLLELVDLSRLHLPVSLTPAELAALRTAEPVDLRLPGASAPVPGRIAFIDPRFDPATRKQRVELALDAAALEAAGLAPIGGLRAEIDLQLAAGDLAVRIPHAFVHRRLEQHFVRATNGAEHAIIPLRSDEDGVIVAAGSLPRNIVLDRTGTAEAATR